MNYEGFTKILSILQNNGLDYETTKRIYEELDKLFIKEKDEKTKDVARFLSSCMFEFKKFYIDYIDYMKN